MTVDITAGPTARERTSEHFDVEEYGNTNNEMSNLPVAQCLGDVASYKPNYIDVIPPRAPQIIIVAESIERASNSCDKVAQ